jgi:hypothetical protein
VPSRVITVQPPLGGLNRQVAYPGQPPFTSPFLENVRTTDVFERRKRLSSRPGAVKAYPEQLYAEYRERVLGHCVPASFTPSTDTTIVIATHDFAFTSAHAGCWLYFTVTGNAYQIKTYTSATTVVVAGETAAAEAYVSGNEILVVAGGTVTTLAYRSATVTFTEATDIVNWSTHALVSGDTVKFTTTDTLPDDLVASTVYYVVYNNGNTFFLADDPTLTNLISIDPGGAGTHTGWDLGRTLVTLGAGSSYDFTAAGGYLRFDTSGNYYQIYAVVDTDHVIVAGDATGESATDTVTVFDWDSAAGSVVMLDKVNPLPDFQYLSTQRQSLLNENWSAYVNDQEPNDVTGSDWSRPTIDYVEEYEFFNDPTASGTGTVGAYSEGRTKITLSGGPTVVSGWANSNYYITFTATEATTSRYITLVDVAGNAVYVNGAVTESNGAVRIWSSGNIQHPIKPGDPLKSQDYVRSNWITESPPIGQHWFVDGSIRDVPDDLNLSKRFAVSLDYQISYWTSGSPTTWATAYILLGISGTHDQLAIGIATGTSPTSDTVNLYRAGAVVASGTLDVRAYPGKRNLTVSIDGDHVQVYHQGNLEIDHTLSTGAETITSYGFFLLGQGSYYETYYAQSYDCNLLYYSTTGIGGDVSNILTSTLVASANGDIWTEIQKGSLTRIRSDIQLRENVRLRAAEFAGLLYIADFGSVKIGGDDGAIALDGSVYKLTSATVNALTDYPGGWADSGLDIDVNNDVVEIYGVTGSTADGIYRITTLADGYMAITGTGIAAATVCTFRVHRAPKVYDPVKRTIERWIADSDGSAQKGIVPCGCPLIARCGGRIYLGGADHNPHVWYASRSGDPKDWDFGADPGDTGKAVSGEAAEYKVIGDPLTAIIGWGDDYVLFACEESMWIMRGDPGLGSGLLNISKQIGIINRWAWCWGPSGEMLFLSRSGLFGMAPGGSVPQKLSESIPDELINIDATTYSCLLSYDHERRGIWIFIVKEAAAPSSGDAEYYSESWFFSMEDRSFCKDRYPYLHDPISLASFSILPAKGSQVLLGCRDGYVRTLDDDESTDDGAAITSRALLGPFMLGGSRDMRGILARIQGDLASGSGDVTYNVYTGESPQEAYNAFLASSVSATGTLSAGSNYAKRPAVGGVCAYVELTSTGRWALEQMLVEVMPRGRARKL